VRRIWLSLILVLVVTSMPLGSEEAAASLYCFGEPITIYASPGVPTLGTAGNDVILGTTGDDIISGGGGHDRICGGAGNDDLRGGRGRDRIAGGDGDDRLNGGNGNDRLVGGTGRDRFIHSAGTDSLFGQGGRDVFDGSATVPTTPNPSYPLAGLSISLPGLWYEGWFHIDGNGTLTSIEIIIGSAFNDAVTTHPVVPTVVRSGPGNDGIWIESHGDRVFGQGGDDHFHGNAAFAVLRGGAGDDTIWSGYRNDIDGGAGDDHCGLDMDVAGTNCEQITLLCGTGTDPLPGTATDITDEAGDFDGDGTADHLQVFRNSGSWWARVETAAGFSIIAPLQTNPAEAARSVGGRDLDGDGVDEAFIVVGQGASSEIVGIYTLFEPIGSPATGFSCGLLPAVFSGTPARAEFTIDAGLFLQSGLACRANHTLREFQQSTLDGVNYTQQRYDYTYDARFASGEPNLTSIGSSAVSLTRPADDPPIDRAGQFTCGGLNL